MLYCCISIILASTVKKLKYVNIQCLHCKHLLILMLVKKPVVRKEPENIILHVGTNDLNKSASPDQIAQGIINLGIQINQDSPQTSITISEILPRTDKSNLLIKASQVNDIVKKYCDQNKWGYINHKAINATCLNSKGLHLNKKGTAIIAKSISSYIINH